MFGFVYTEGTRRLLSEGPEELFENLSSEKLLRATNSLLTDDISEENRRLFGDFREREKIRAYARITNGEAVLFVNYDRGIAFEQPLKSAIRSLFADLITNIPQLQLELADAESKWRSEATRIVSPIWTIADINFYTLEKPDLFFAQVIEAALRVLDIPEGTGLGVIHLYNAELEILELRGSFGPIEHIERATRHSVTKGDGVVSWIALTRRAVVIQDLEASEFRKIHISLNDNSKSELAVPIEAGGELIGTMCLESTEANRFKPHHARSVWYAANKAAIAYQLHQLASINRELLQLCWRATNNTEGGAPVSLGQVATLAKDFLKASLCDISRFNPDTETFDTGEASYEGFKPQVRTDGWTNYIRQSRSPIWIGGISDLTHYSIHRWEKDKWIKEDCDKYPTTLNEPAVEGGVRSALGIPITVRGKCIAVAWVKYKRQRFDCPKPGLMSLVLGFAAEAGLVLDSIERQEVDLKERNEIESLAGQMTNLIVERWNENSSDIVESSVNPSHFIGSYVGTSTRGSELTRQL